jgi:hypothetical protein
VTLANYLLFDIKIYWFMIILVRIDNQPTLCEINPGLSVIARSPERSEGTDKAIS